MIDLEELPVTDSIEFLRERMLHAPVPLQLEPHPGHEIVVRSRVADLGGIHLLCTKAQGGDVLRTPRLVARDPRPSLMVSVMDHGVTTVVRDDAVVRAHPGDVALYTTDEPYRLSFTPGAVRLTYQIPFERLGLPQDVVRSQLRSVLRPQDALSAGAAGFLRDVARRAPQDGTEQLAALEAPTLELVRLLLTRSVATTPLGRRAVADSLATRVEQHVRNGIGDATLSVRSIAQAFAISERYVYLILARRGIDLGAMVRAHRMDRAVRMLADDGRTLAQIAYECGFADHAHFTRAFRARFGMPPSLWRVEMRRKSADGSSS